MFVEYHAKQITDDWKGLLEVDPDWDLSLGNLFHFFRLDVTDELELTCQETVREVIDNPVFNNTDLVEVRNELAHGHIDRLSENEYAAVKSAVTRIIDATAAEMPVLVTPTSETVLGETRVYSMHLHWSRPQERTWIETKAELEVEQLYFIGPEAIPEDPDVGRWEVPSTNICQCTERRAREAV